MLLQKGLISVDQLSTPDINTILDRAKFYKARYKGKDKKVGGLNGLTMVNMFFEPSTRTRLSFELAAKRMGVHVVNIIADASAMVKGESTVDTIKTLNAMRPDALVIRTSQNGLPYEITRYTDAEVINAGDGTNEHPTQALLDLYSMREVSQDILSVAIIGDLAHSRVAKSNVKLLLNLGHNVKLISPPNWAPNPRDWGIEEYVSKGQCVMADELKVEDTNIVMALRVQKERFSDQHRGLIDLKSYNEQFGIRHGTLRDDQTLMHPGPVNRGVEIDEDLVYCPQSIILDQVENGVAVRSAILEHLLRE